MIKNAILFDHLEDGLDIQPNEFHIEHNGHLNFYATHECPICEVESPCKTQLCKQPFNIECLPCARRELLEDTERFAKELKGLAERAREIQKRQDMEGKS